MKRLLVYATLALIVVLALAGIACAKATPTLTPRGGATGERFGPAGTPAPAPTVIPGVTPTPLPFPRGGPAVSVEAATKQDGLGTVEQLLAREGALASAPEQQRIIVRTVDMKLVVNDVSSALGSVSSLAVQLGGWVVSSKQEQRHSGSIAIRVPAQRVEEALLRLRGLAVKVEAEVSSSQDFTDEYVDTQARVKNLQATEVALAGLLGRAQLVEDALKVQAELTKVQEEIEKAQGRLNFLGQTSAFSLINVALQQVSQAMAVDGGPDQSVREDAPARFRATFVPPEGVTDFTFQWDFGDGSASVAGSRTAPAAADGTRTTATVTHVYSDSLDSPFIVTVTGTGTGEAGVAEGKDTLMATVSKVPPIEVYAGPDLTVVEGEEVAFSGSFTRSEGLQDFQFRWEFGDGSPPMAGGLPSSVTAATATHVYPNHRPDYFNALLTVTASSEAGPVEATDNVLVWVTPAEPWAGRWDPAGTLRGAVLALTETAQALGMIAIWLAIFSPFWGGGLAVAYFLRRRSRRKKYI